MSTIEQIKKPTKAEQKTAIESYNSLASVLDDLKSINPTIEIEETEEKIKIPLRALKLLEKILMAMSKGQPISIVPIATEMTTQAAAEFLGCSRPHLVKLLEEGKIPFTKIGKHRRVKFEDVSKFKSESEKKQKKLLIEMINADEDSNLYDS